MKKGWLAAAVLCVMAGVALWHVWTLGELTGGLQGELARAEAMAGEGDWPGAAQVTRSAQQRWKDQGFYLHITLDHAVTDEISVGFAETLGFLERQNGEEYAAANGRLMELLGLLGEMERPLLENLL